MKKLMLVLAIGAFVACNDSSDANSNANDSIPATVDTNTVAPVDTTSAPVDSVGVKTDTTAAK